MEPLRGRSRGTFIENCRPSKPARAASAEAAHGSASPAQPLDHVASDIFWSLICREHQPHVGLNILSEQIILNQLVLRSSQMI
jgi:hypothetical protein